LLDNILREDENNEKSLILDANTLVAKQQKNVEKKEQILAKLKELRSVSYTNRNDFAAFRTECRFY
jgi:hypothetical protein